MKMKSTLALAAMFMGLGWPAAAAEKAPQFKVMAGTSYKNLQVYFLTGADRVKGIQYLPLDAAMKNGIAKVNETGNVRSLTIENLSGEKNVFINSGDIIKGGRQDRYLANTLVVPPKSGRVSMASFCVESGRWAQRGLESASKFSRSKFSAASLEQRLAAQVHMDQGMLWKQVARSRHMYRVALLRHHGLLNPPASPIPAGSPQTQSEQRSLADAARALQMSTSLQLALENKGLQKITQQYVHHMNGNLSEYSDAVGFVFAINGEIIGADVYGQASLFRALWPKLIYAAATEAMAKLDDKKKVKPLKREHFLAFFRNKKQSSPTQRELNVKTLLITLKGDRHILLETRDLRASASWLHRSYLATP